MASNTTSKVFYIQADSGYLSDLVDATHMGDEAVEALLPSSRSDRSTGFILSSFDDTLWEGGLTHRKLAQKDKESVDIVAKIKMPKYFPINPLPETLARARAEAARPVSKYGLISTATGLLEYVSNLEKRGEDDESAPACAAVGQDLFEQIESGFSNRDAAAQFEDFLSTDDSNATFTQDQRNFQPRKIVVVNRKDQAKTVRMELPETMDPASADTRGRTRFTSNKHQPIASVDSFGRTRAASKRISKELLSSHGALKASHKRKSVEAPEGAGHAKSKKLDMTK